MANEIKIVVSAQDQASPVLNSVRGAAAPLESTFASLQSKALLASAGITAVAVAGGAAARVISSLASAASDMEESQNKANVVFGQSATVLNEFAKSSAMAAGISRQAALEAGASFGSMFYTAGLAKDAAAEMSTQMVQLAADMASFNNQDPSEMLLKLRSGLAGEAEPLRTVGVLLSEARVKQEAYATGIAATGAELTEAQKVQARYSLILKDTSLQQGDFGRTSDGLANKQRQLGAEFANLKAKIGEGLVGPMEGAVGVTTGLISNISKLIDLATKPIEFTVKVNGQTTTQQGPSFMDVVGDILGPGGMLDPTAALGGGALFGISKQDADFGKLKHRLARPDLQGINTKMGGLAGNAKFPLFDPASDTFDALGGPAASVGFDWDGFNQWAIQNGVKGLNQEGSPEAGVVASLLGFDKSLIGGAAGGAKFRAALSAGNLGRIGGILGQTPGSPAAGDVAGFDAAVLQFKNIRSEVSREMAALGLSMADLSANGGEGTEQFKAMDETMTALRDAMSRLDMIETVRLDHLRDAAEIAREAAEAEKELGEVRRRERADLLQAAWRGGASSFGGAMAAAAALANPGQSFSSADFNADGTMSRSSSTVNYGTINVNVQGGDTGGGVVPGLTAVG